MNDYIKMHQNTLGLTLFLRRRELGLTQKRLSELSGVNRSEISAIEIGINVNPEYRTLLRLLYVLKLRLDIAPEKEATQ